MVLAVNFKLYLCDFIIKKIFESASEYIKMTTDELVIQNNQLNDKHGVGFIVNGHQFVHSSAQANMNLSFMQLNRSELLPAHPDIVAKALDLLDHIGSQDIDRMRFKGLINGMLSVVKNNRDFDIVFHDMFTDEVKQVNKEGNLNLGANPPLKVGHKEVTVTEENLRYVEELKAKFKQQYDRYRFMKEVVGI